MAGRKNNERAMLMFKVYIEESAFGTPQPMELSPDASIGELIPALVEELRLPQIDLFGNRLTYFLSHAVDGRLLPNHFNLHTAGIRSEDHLSLKAYRMEDAPVPVLAAPVALATSQKSSFYADQTIADSSAFGQVGHSAPLVLSPPPMQQTFISGDLPEIAPMPGTRRRSRRAFLLVGAALGAAGVGLAYAAYHTLSGTQNAHTPPGMFQQMRATTSTATATTKSPVQSTLPTHATYQLVFRQHQQTVHAVAWSPDGTALASGASDRQIFIWNINGQVQVNKDLGATVHALTWSPDSHQLAAAATNQIFFFKAQNGMTEAHSTHTHHANVTALAWSPQQPQLLVSGSLDKLAVVWDTQTFQPQTFFRQHTAGILAASWASDGQTIATSSQGGVVRIWNGPHGQEVHGFFFDGAVSMNAVAFDPHGTRLAAGGMDGTLRLWPGGLNCQQMGSGNTQGQCLDAPQHLTGHTQAIRALGWSPDGRFLATAGDDGQLLVWYPAQSQTPLFKVTQGAPILALSWSPDGKQIATASSNTVTLWALS